MGERKAGYYWTKVDDEWEPAFHQGDGDWRIYGGFCEDDWFDEIGPRIPTPDEAWKVVPVELTPSMRRAGQHAKEHDCYIDGIYADILAETPDP